MVPYGFHNSLMVFNSAAPSTTPSLQPLRSLTSPTPFSQSRLFFFLYVANPPTPTPPSHPPPYFSFLRSGQKANFADSSKPQQDQREDRRSVTKAEPEVVKKKIGAHLHMSDKGQPISIIVDTFGLS